MLTADKYIMRRQVAGILGALFVIAGFDFVADFIGEADKVNAEYTLAHAFVFSLLSVPQRAGDLAPAAVLIGTVMSLGALSANFEWTAMRAGGYSKYALMRPAMLVGVLVGVLVAVNGEWVAPYASRAAETMKERVESEPSDTTQLQAGDRVWLRDRGRFITAVSSDGERRFRDAVIFEFHDGGLREVVRAEEMLVGDGTMTLSEVRRGEFMPDDMSFEAVARLETPLSSWALEVRSESDPAGMTASELLDYVRFLRANRLSDETYELALWTRLGHPLSAVVLLLLAIPYVFAPPRRTGTAQRLFVGIMLGLVCFILNRALSSFALIQSWPAWVAAFLPLAVLALIGVWRLRLCR